MRDIPRRSLMLVSDRAPRVALIQVYDPGATKAVSCGRKGSLHAGKLLGKWGKSVGNRRQSPTTRRTLFDAVSWRSEAVKAAPFVDRTRSPSRIFPKPCASDSARFVRR